MSDHATVSKVIDAQLQRADLTSEDVLRLTLARRLNNCSDHDLRVILSGQPETPKKRRGLLADMFDL